MCVLRVSGKKFDAPRFLAGSRLKPYSVFRVGEPILASRPVGKVHKASGFKVDVSRSSWGGLTGQVLDAIAFLKKHKRKLARLQTIPEVEDVRLDFPIDLRVDRKKVFAQFDYFPPALVVLAGELGCGLELSIYPRDFERLARAKPKRSRKRTGPTERQTLAENRRLANKPLQPTSGGGKRPIGGNGEGRSRLSGKR